MKIIKNVPLKNKISTRENSHISARVIIFSTPENNGKTRKMVRKKMGLKNVKENSKQWASKAKFARVNSEKRPENYLKSMFEFHTQESKNKKKYWPVATCIDMSFFLLCLR